MIRALSLLLFFFQDLAIAPHSAMEPAAARAAASLAASTKASPPELLTTGEKSDWNETAPYAEAVEIARRLERASRFVKVETIGKTPEGRDTIALIVSKDRAFTPEAAAKTGKVVMLIQSGIHAGEIEGKDPVLMLVRDMVVGKKYAAWLDHMIFVIIPVFNVDGHEYFSPYHRPSQNGPKSTGLRANAQRMNLNRDYIKADTPEMRAWLKLFNAWNPDFHIDNHVTDGSDFQYDVTWDMARNQDIAEPAGTWVRERFVPELDKRMTADGHMVAPYGALRGTGGKREFFMEVFSPRYSHLYSAVLNRPSMLVESHSLKAAKTRAWAHYDIMRHTIETILLDPEGLRKAVREADRQMAARAGDRSAAPVYLAGKVSEKSRPLVYHALKNGGLTKNLWDNLSGFAKIGSINLLATSRKPLRQLCKSASGRSSDFWERFEDPPVRLKAFTAEEIQSFLRPLREARGGFAAGVEGEFANWTGGIPRLAVCLARRLFQTADSPVTIANVRSAAEWALAEHTDALEAAWDVFTAEEQTGFADLIEKREVDAREAGRLAHALIPLGLAQTSGNKIRPSCDLLKRFTSSIQSGLVSVKLLFGETSAYDRNIRGVVEWRLKQIAVRDPELKDFVTDAVARVGNPKLFFKEIRNIVDHALKVIWDAEAPDGHSPRYESEFAAKYVGHLNFRDVSNLLRHLQLATDDRNRVSLKRANRRIYTLLNALQGYGDLGQHQRNEVMPPAFAAAACLTVVELVAEMDKAGF